MGLFGAAMVRLAAVKRRHAYYGLNVMSIWIEGKGDHRFGEPWGACMGGDSRGLKAGFAVILTASTGSIGIAGQITEAGDPFKEWLRSLGRRYRRQSARRAGGGRGRVAAHDYPPEAVAAARAGIFEVRHSRIIVRVCPLVKLVVHTKTAAGAATRPTASVNGSSSWEPPSRLWAAREGQRIPPLRA